MTTKPFQFLHTTEKSPQSSASEAMQLLGIIGASNVSMQMEHGDLVGMTFQVKIGEKVISYRLPVKWKQIYDTMLKIESKKRTYWRNEAAIKTKTEAQAKRTAWRMMLEWLKIQTAFVENGIRHPAEVFLADMIVKTDEGVETTMGQMMIERGAIPLIGMKA